MHGVFRPPPPTQSPLLAALSAQQREPRRVAEKRPPAPHARCHGAMLSLVVVHAAKTTPQTASLAPNPAETVSDLPLSNGYFRPTPHGGTGARCERPLR